MDYSAIIDRLEAQIRQYRVEYQRFFNGDAKTPPEDQGAKIRQRLNQLATISQLQPVERFRLTGLEGRYNSLSELFRRRLREMDLAPQQFAGGGSGTDDGTTASAVLRPTAGTEDVGTLYDALYSGTDSSVALEDFHAYLVDQAAEVCKRTGCTDVRFIVRSEDGKKRLKARPVVSGD